MSNGNFNRWVLERRKERIWEWNEGVWWRNDEEIEERSGRRVCRIERERGEREEVFFESKERERTNKTKTTVGNRLHYIVIDYIGNLEMCNRLLNYVIDYKVYFRTHL